MVSVPCGHVAEITFAAARPHENPSINVRLDVLFTSPRGELYRVPAFWAGGSTWKARYSSYEPGQHTYVSVCSVRDDAGLHGVEGALEVVPYEGDNRLYRHGPPVVSPNKRYLQHSDGTPFFWLADTWWMGLCKRLPWPEGFHILTADRKAKGFTVVQLVAGLYPDMGAFDERGANEAGFPWEPDWKAIRPEYFDRADERISHLVESGIVPCIVGAWGYYLPWLGPDKMKHHWRTVIARWGAYPVVWCVAGEANLPWYLVPGFPYDDRDQVTGWTDIAAFVRRTDPFNRLVSVHPTGLGRLSARGAIDDQQLLDFDMLQTGHGDRSSLGPTVETVRWSYVAEPTMPVLNSEVNYEGILGRCHDDVQRLMFWVCILNGACGHTYGANGIWQVNEPDRPFGNSPHGGTYGPTPWNEAMNLPGSSQLSRSKALLERYAWYEFKPHPEWATYEEGHEARDEWHVPHSAGISDQVRFIYVPQGHPVKLHHLGSLSWQARAYDLGLDREADLGTLRGDGTGSATVVRPFPEDSQRAEQDWLLIIEKG